MTVSKAIATSLVAMLGFAASEAADAHGYRRGHIGLGIVIGAPLLAYPAYSHYYYGRPWRYYDPPAYYTQPAPPQYIERDAVEAAPVQPQGYWHFCPESNAYYPYVKSCPGGWQRVSPTPPPR